MSGDYVGIRFPGITGGPGWNMNLGFWATIWQDMSRSDSMAELVKFVITEVYPDGIDLKTADEIWMKIQKIPMW